jgi:predicted helicase
MTALTDLLNTFRAASKTEREKGTYFENLTVSYLTKEPAYRDLYSHVMTFAEWATEIGYSGKDNGIDLIAKTRGTNEWHAIQCKFYADDKTIDKNDINSFLAESGKSFNTDKGSFSFAQRLFVTTTNKWTENASDTLQAQSIPCFKIDLYALEQSLIDWSQYQSKASVVTKPKKTLRAHQTNALSAAVRGLGEADRGKLIMACGTGKTFTSLKIAETIAGKDKRVLFLVPSLSLLSQTLTEWTQESAIPLHSFAVCSDSEVGKKRNSDDDLVQTLAHELQYPATTDAKQLAKQMTLRHDGDHMSVVFSTYHSIEVINQAQIAHGMPAFDLIVCDEAHRTTGAVFDGDDESAFVRIHNASYVQGAKRLYMTATPRIYGEAAKISADSGGVELSSMDDELKFGKELFVITFNEAVQRGLLVDYKVVVLAMDEAHVSTRMQQMFKDEDNNLKIEDAAKIIGCWKALSKQDTQEDLADDAAPMRRAVAFCQTIEQKSNGKTHKISSKKIASMFSDVIEYYKESAPEDEIASTLKCEASHVDGGMSATEKEAELAWLKSPVPDNTCRILSNVRCLSEGVDVPALDAVLFLTPRNSQVDVVQSVGRVMRLAEGKKRGYIIIPVVIPAGMEPEAALNDNKTYKVVWDVLNALRSHDDRFDAMINRTELVGADKSRMEVIAVTDKVQRRTKTGGEKGKGGVGRGGGGVIGTPKPKPKGDGDAQTTMTFDIGEIERSIYAKIVKKCGNRLHWEEWATDIAKIAQTHITRIKTILDNPANTTEIASFTAFANELRDDLNDSISDNDIIEMLAQHLITKPVFDALFKDYSFASKNPMSQAMQKVIDTLQEHHLDKEADTLEKFYASVRMRAEGIDTAAGKQKIVVDLYDKFFSKAFPRMRDALGIVYTPVEVVDFIIHSVNDVLKNEFNTSLGDKGVHIIDPFTGTGTFITRLLQSGLMTPDEIKLKYKTHIHANEIVLLAYYIAAINIESVYHDLVGGDYVPFEGICLTDTFQMYEREDMIDELLVHNSARRKRQKALDIRVIIGNPPYSIAKGTEYPHLDGRIESTYANRSSSVLKNSLYDSYIRAIRWATDRLGDSGVLAFISGSGYVEKSAMDGMRKTLVEEFSTIYVLNLRGDIRKNMLSKGLAREGQNIFGSGSMTGISITLFVKNPESKVKGQVLYHDIGEDLTREEKLRGIQGLSSVNGISNIQAWQKITPDDHGDWLKQRDQSFGKFLVLGDKRNLSGQIVLFESYSGGLMTQRDSWCYGPSKQSVASNMKRMVSFYNSEVERFKAAHSGLDKKEREEKVDSFISSESEKISWTRALKQELVKERQFAFELGCMTPSLYRPFTKQWLYFSRRFNEMVLQMPRFFPGAGRGNLVICVSGVGARSGFSAYISNQVVERQAVDNGQCFPLYLYDDEPKPTDAQSDIFATSKPAERTRRDAITNEGLKHFTDAYPSQFINKEDLFYYVYGLLHSSEYREQYADNLSKELPRIPRVKTYDDFWAFSKAGRDLANLHLNYETITPYAGAKVTIKGLETSATYRVTKMKFGKGKDKTMVIYNDFITIEDIPENAYDYVVNGKAALDWVMERQVVKTDKDSGIVNDANDWANETMNNPKYPLELFLRVITVSLETQKIVNALPALTIFDDTPTPPPTKQKQHAPDSPGDYSQHWLNDDTVILDTETTGLADTDQIIEIAVVSGTGDVLLNTRVKPTVAINPHAQNVHGISISDLKAEQSWREIHDKFCKLIAGKRVVAFNADFDIRMIQQTAAAHGLSVDLPKTNCAMALAAHQYGSSNKYGSISLANAVAEAGISFQGDAHSALGDTLTTLALIKKIAE